MDILGIGVCAVDDVLYVSGYPSADSKAEVLRRERRCGGLTAIALMTAARLGASCQYAGVLGDDELSQFVMKSMRDEGVDTSRSIWRAEARPVHSTIIVDERTGSRAILYETKNVFGADDQLPSADLIRSARVLYLDQYGIPGGIRASRIAREARIPIVADLEADQLPRFGELLDLVDHLILSRDFACRITGQSTPAAAAQKLWRNDRSVVVVTAGTEGCWYTDGSAGGKPGHCPAFRVIAQDTTGCGDVFHGAYAASLAKGMNLPDRLRLASAAAALKATKPGIPTTDDVDQFLAPHL